MDRIIAYYKTFHDTSLTSSKEEDDSNIVNDFNVKELEELVQQMIIGEDLCLDNVNSISLNNLSCLDGDLDKIKNCKTKNGYQLLTNTNLYASTFSLHSSPNLKIKGYRKASKQYLDQLKQICKSII